MNKLKFSYLVLILVFSNSVSAEPLFERGVVVSKNPIASQIGANILAQGGNAIDAAIGTGYALGVVEPQGSGIGGGGFALIYLAKNKQLKAIDFRERAPENINHFDYEFRNGPKATGIPGTIAGFEYLRQKYGKLPRKASLKEVIHTAKNGFEINKTLHDAIESRQKTLKEYPSSAQIYLPEGKVPKSIKQIDLGNTLEIIAQKGAQEFYKGNLAKKIVAETQKTGGFWTLNDLRNYRVFEWKPVCGNYRGQYKVCSFLLPSSGGICIIEALNILNNFDMSSLSYKNPERLHYLIEALRFSFADRANKLGDPRFNQIPVSELISQNYADKIAKHIQASNYATLGIPSQPVFTNSEKPETTHYTVADKEGNIVAITFSLNGSLGSGFVIPNTGILLNNTLDDFSLPSSTPNQYGLIGNNLNAPMPGKTPLSSMSPTIVFDKSNKPILALGSPGGPTIISAVLNTLLAVLDQKMPIVEAVAAGRIHHQWQPDHVYAEDWLINEELKNTLIQKYNYVFPSSKKAVWPKFYWSVQAIELNWLKRRLVGSSDPRREEGLVYEKQF